jgi:hypothetical protein
MLHDSYSVSLNSITWYHSLHQYIKLITTVRTMFSITAVSHGHDAATRSAIAQSV